MKKGLIFFFHCCLMATPLTALPDEAINFRSGDFQSIREYAVREGKPLFVHFTASWCMPCQWMEKNAYQDKQLADFVNKNFLPVKIDIDDQEGGRVKDEFQIKALPSLLIFDNRSIVVGRYEESMPASRLELILRQHYQDLTGKTTMASAPPSPVLKPAGTQTETVFRPDQAQENLPSTRIPSTASPASDNISLVPASSTTPTPFTEPSAISPSNSRYGIQLGVFSTYENANHQLRQYRNRFSQPVSIYAGVLEGENVYRILLGTFNSKDEALALAQQFKEKQQMQVIVKDLSKL